MESKPIYRTAEELQIEQWEHDGLVALVGPLSRGELRVDMGVASGDECGTVACIGGWLATITRKDATRYVMRDASLVLGPLFYPGGAHKEFCLIRGDISVPNDEEDPGWKANAPQAARAIVNFLVTGDPQWTQVMAEAA